MGRRVWSQLIVKLVLVRQVDPAEHERGQGQGEQHDEDGRARVAFFLRLTRGSGGGRPAGRVCDLSLTLTATLLGATLPGATLPGTERASRFRCDLGL